MSKKEFSPAQEAAEVAASMDDESSLPAIRDMSGDLGMCETIDLPRSVRPSRLSIVFGTSTTVVPFSPGSLVLDKEFLVAALGDVLEVVPVRYKEYLKENKAHDPLGEYPQEWQTKEEALAAGFPFTPDWYVKGKPTCSIAVAMQLLIKKPKGLLSPVLTIPIMGEEYIPAEWLLDKMGAAKTSEFFFTASQSMKARGLLSGKLTLCARLKKAVSTGHVSIWPVWTTNGFNSDEFITDAKKAFSGGK